MKHFMIKFILALALGLGLTFALLGVMSTFETGLSVAHAADHTVCSDGPPTCMFTNVQAAVDAAGEGDVIKIASGTYTDVNNYGGLAQVVYISKSVTIRGGYMAAFTEPPNPDANPTTLDAQGQGRVLYITGDISPTIEGLRITGGNASYGGGVCVISATASLVNNWIFNNTSTNQGGGIFLSVSNALIKGNQITSNTTDYLGGGLFVGGEARIEGNTISDNTAHGGGGALLIGGGGIFQNVGSATLDHNTIFSNSAYYGGGLDLVASTAMFTSNLIHNNIARECGGCSDGEGLGGGLLLDQWSDAILINNVIFENQADIAGAGLIVSDSSPQLLHNTIARNTGGDESGIHLFGRLGIFSSVSLTNTILVSQTVGITVATGNTATLESTLWGSGAWANGTNTSGAGTIITGNNYTGDPAFVDPDNGDYHINSASAAIDKGIDAGVTSDIDDEIRDAFPDLGADELGPAGMPQIIVEGGNIWAANETTSLKLLSHNIVDGPFDIKLYDKDDVFVQTIITGVSGLSTEPISWTVFDMEGNGKPLCDQASGQQCTIQSHRPGETGAYAETKIYINQPSIVSSNPGSDGSYARGEIVYIWLLSHTPGKRYHVQISGLTVSSDSATFDTQETNEFGHLTTPITWLITDECGIGTGWPDGTYIATSHPLGQAAQIAVKDDILLQTPASPYLTIEGGNTWPAGSMINIRVILHRANEIHYLEFDGQRIPTAASDDTFTTGVCGEAIIPYQIPITTTEGGYTISSFLNNGNAKQAEMGINVLIPEPEPDQQIYLPIVLKE